MKGQPANHVAAAEERRRREAQDFLAVDIAKGDNESVTLSVRASIERGYLNTFNESLKEGLKKKKSEIDRICARNYSEVRKYHKYKWSFSGTYHMPLVCAWCFDE